MVARRRSSQPSRPHAYLEEVGKVGAAQVGRRRHQQARQQAQQLHVQRRGRLVAGCPCRRRRRLQVQQLAQRSDVALQQRLCSSARQVGPHRSQQLRCEGVGAQRVPEELLLAALPGLRRQLAVGGLQRGIAAAVRGVTGGDTSAAVDQSATRSCSVHTASPCRQQHTSPLPSTAHLPPATLPYPAALVAAWQAAARKASTPSLTVQRSTAEARAASKAGPGTASSTLSSRDTQWWRTNGGVVGAAASRRATACSAGAALGPPALSFMRRASSITCSVGKGQGEVGGLLCTEMRAGRWPFRSAAHLIPTRPAVPRTHPQLILAVGPRQTAGQQPGRPGQHPHLQGI